MMLVKVLIPFFFRSVAGSSEKDLVTLGFQVSKIIVMYLRVAINTIPVKYYQMDARLIDLVP